MTRSIFTIALLFTFLPSIFAVDCSIDNLFAEAYTECNEDGASYNVDIEFTVTDGNNSGFDVFINGVFYNYYDNYLDPFITLENVAIADGEPIYIRVQDNDNPDCWSEFYLANTPRCTTICNTEHYELDLGYPGFEFLWELDNEPQNGTVTFDSGQYLTYLPNPDFVGTETIVITHYSPVGGPKIYYYIQLTVEDCPIGDCGVDNVVVNFEGCNADGTYNAFVTFEHIDASYHLFDLWINEALVGTYELSDLPIWIENITSSDTGFEYAKVCFNDDPTCCNSVQYILPPCGQNDECQIVDLWIDQGDCDADSNYYAHIGFEVLNSTNEFFDLWINNEFHGYYHIGELPLYVENITPNENIDFDIIEVCVNDNPDCCAALEYMPIPCYHTDECFMAAPLCDIECISSDEYIISIFFEYYNTSDSFQVLIHNEYLDTYAYTDLPVVLGVYSTSNPTFGEIIIADIADPECYITMTPEVPECYDGDCQINEIWVETDHCNEDGTYNAFINFDAWNAGNDFFDLWINNQFVDNYFFGDLPLYYENISPRENSDYDFVEICINDNPDCCAIYEYYPPDCTQTDECELFSPACDILCVGTDTFGLIVLMEGYNISDSFTITDNNGLSYGTHTYQEPALIGPFAADGTHYEFIITDSENEDCVAEMIPGVVICDELELCSIETISMEVGECIDGTYDAYLDFDAMNVTNEFFDLWVNNEFHGYYDLSSLPLHLENITPRFGSDYDLVEICINDNLDCCAIYEYMAPDCISPLICTGFDELEMGEEYNEATQPPGANLFNINGINATLEPFTYFDGSTDIHGVWVDHGIEAPLEDNALWISNSTLLFDFSDLNEPTTQVRFDYWDGGGEENIAINGMPVLVVNDFSEVPQNIAPDVTLTLSFTPPFVGQIILEGNIQSLKIGGQEFMLDNLCYALPSTADTNGPTTAVTDIALANNLNIYPNPTSDILYIDAHENRPIQQIELYDILGQRVYQKTNPNNKLDLSDFQTGLYFLQVDYGTTKVTRKVKVVR